MKKLNTLLLTCLMAFGFYSASAQFNATISGTVSNMSAGDTVTIYYDSLGGVFNFSNGQGVAVGPNGRYSINMITYSAALTVWMIDCKKDTLVDSTYVSGMRPQAIVNFNYCKSVPPPANRYSTVSGTVYTSAPGTGIVTNGKVLLIKKDSGLLTAVDTVNVGQRGGYNFTIMDSNSQYLVKAILNFTTLNHPFTLPTYADSALKWSGAAVIPSGNNQTHTKNIWMKTGTNPGGPGFVGGLVSQGANKSSAQGDPIIGAQVMLLQNNKPVAYTFSDAQGKFEISNLAYGTYTVYTEVSGLPTVSADVTLSADKEKEEGVRVTINSSGVTTDVEVVAGVNESVSRAWKGFPNPVSDNLTINFGTLVNGAIITILDITGKTIETVNAENTSEVPVSMSGLNRGTYFVQVQTETASRTFKVSKR